MGLVTFGEEKKLLLLSGFEPPSPYPTCYTYDVTPAGRLHIRSLMVHQNELQESLVFYFDIFFKHLVLTNLCFQPLPSILRTLYRLANIFELRISHSILRTHLRTTSTLFDLVSRLPLTFDFDFERLLSQVEEELPHYRSSRLVPWLIST